MKSMTISQTPWCKKFDRPIDYDLVKTIHPDCVERLNGCGNCPEQISKVDVKSEGEVK